MALYVFRTANSEFAERLTRIVDNRQIPAVVMVTETAPADEFTVEVY